MIYKNTPDTNFNQLASNKGFAISSLLYPVFILIITFTVLTLLTLIQSSFSVNKLTSEVQGDLTDNNTMKSMKENAQSVLNDSKDRNTINWVNDPDGKINLYNVTQGNIKLVNQSGQEIDSDLTINPNTIDWTGRFFTESDGSQFLLINNGKYCAYKTGDMSGVAVYNSGSDKTNECVKKLAEQTNCSEVVTMMDNQNTVTTLQNQVADLLARIGVLETSNNNLVNLTNQQATRISSLESNNTETKDFLKSHPIGSIYVSTDSTNPGNTYTGSTWVAYAGGRTLIGAGSTTDARGTYASFSGGQTGGEYYQALDGNNLPSHAHTYYASASLQNGWFDGTIYNGSCYATGTTDGDGNHSHNTHSNWSFQTGSGGWNTATGASDDPLGNATSVAGWHTHTFHTSGCSVSGNAHGGVSGSISVSGTTSYAGSNTAFNIQNPYIVVYIWKRTA